MFENQGRQPPKLLDEMREVLRLHHYLPALIGNSNKLAFCSQKARPSLEAPTRTWD